MHAGKRLWQLRLGALVFAPIRLHTLAPEPTAASGDEACSCCMPASGPHAALADSDDNDDVAAGVLAHGLPETHALVACKDGSLQCVDARAGRLIWRLAAACGAPSGASGAAVDVPLGSLMVRLQGGKHPVVQPHPDTGSHGSRRGAGGGTRGRVCADSLVSPGECSGAGLLEVPCPADAVSLQTSARARVALCSASGALAVLRGPRDSRAVAGAQLPAESFSAPVAFDGRIVQGCRDDHLYCLTWH